MKRLLTELIDALAINGKLTGEFARATGVKLTSKGVLVELIIDCYADEYGLPQYVYDEELYSYVQIIKALFNK